MGAPVPAPVTTTLAAAACGVALVLLGACSSDSGGGETVAITSTATTCDVAKTQLTAGKYTFTVANKGSDVTEVYVYAPGDKIVTEKEHIGPGTEAKFSVKLAAGEYEIACKPGEKGNGIRQKITVA